DIDIHINGIQVLSLLTVVNMFFIILFTSLFSKWINKKNKPLTMYYGFALFAIGFSICIISNNIFVLLAATVVLSIGELIYVPLRQTILADIVNISRRGAYMALDGLRIQI